MNPPKCEVEGCKRNASWRSKREDGSKRYRKHCMKCRQQTARERRKNGVVQTQ